MSTAAGTILRLMLRRARAGTLVVAEDGVVRRYGKGAPEAQVSVRSPRAWSLLLRGSTGLADGYAAGLWDSPDLVQAIRFAARNAGWMNTWRARLTPISGPLQRARSLLRPSTRARQRQDIAAHYDLGNELFARMLDPTLTYSCAIFSEPDATLEQAQLAKLDAVCDKLELAPDDRVLEIGTGWGSFALHAARTRGCHVTTTTISREQHNYAVEQVRRHGLKDRVTVLRHDYRDLRGAYDKLVSIEMIEAVGYRRLGTFFAACSRLLAPHGAMLLQAIVIDDRAYDLEKASRTFIKTRIFPGGALPSLAAMTHELARRTDLQVADLHDITAHYVTTLRRWRERFMANWETLSGLGYDERFRRLWTLYLAYCEAGFAERRICDLQLLLAKPRCRLESLRHGVDPRRALPRTEVQGPTWAETLTSRRRTAQ
jgi:cyclopropane-fatty-acyl-phospholipid synthase